MARSKLLMLLLAVFLLAMVCRPANSAEPSEQDEAQKGGDAGQNDADAKAFLKAAEEGNLKQVEALLGKVDINVTDEEQHSALDLALLNKRVDVARFLIAQDIDVNQRNNIKHTALFIQIWVDTDKDIEIAQLLLAAGADLKVRNKWGDTPLTFAVQHGNTDIASFLISNGADIHAKSGSGKSLLDLASTGNHKALVEQLLAKGLQTSDAGESAQKAFLTAAYQGDLKTIQSLIGKVGVNATDTRGHFALRSAIEHGNIELAKFLIEHDADVTYVASSDLQFTPLHWVAMTNGQTDVEMTRLLLAAGANIWAKNSAGSTPLRLAIQKRNMDVVRILIGQQDPQAKDDFGLTSLHYAAMLGNKDVVKQLLVAGANINTEDTIGRTPLHFAISTGNAALRDILIQEGASKDIAPMQPGRSLEFGERAAIGSLGLEQQYISGDTGEPAVQTVELAFGINEDAVTIYAAPEGHVYLHMPPLMPFVRPGEPQLPMKTFEIKLPPGSEVVSVEVTEGQFSTIQGTYRIIPGQQPPQNTSLYYPNEDNIYERHVYYPGHWVKYDTGKDNNNTYAFVRFYPVQYLPTEGKLVVVTEAKLRVHYRPAQENVQVGYNAEGDGSGAQMEAETLIPATNAHSIIIVPNSIPAAGKLKTFHERQGISTAIVTIESIDASYSPAEDVPFEGYANSGVKGRNAIVNYDYKRALKIISYLRDIAAHPELEYVTIIGDGALVPASYVYSQVLHGVSSSSRLWGTTDLFYTSPDYDFVPNYKVGRLPVNNNEEALAVVEKLERWHRHANQEWFRHVYIHSGTRDLRGILYNIGTLYVDNHLMEDIVTGMRVTHSLESEGTFTPERLQAALRDGGVGFVILRTHGSPEGVVAGNGWVTAQELMAYQRVDELPIVIGVSCQAGQWARDYIRSLVRINYNHRPSFGEATVKSNATGIAYLGSDTEASGGRMSFYYDQGQIRLVRYVYFGEIGYRILKSYHEGADTLGMLTYDGLFDFVANNEMDCWLNRYTLFQFVLLGDPALKIPPKEKQPSP